MSTFTFYNNKIIGEGHSSPHICSEISYGFYLILSILADKKMVLEYEFETGSGKSYMIFEENDYTKEIIESYYKSFLEWTKSYNKKEVKVVRIFKESD